MANEYNVGRAYLQILPSFRGLETELRATAIKEGEIAGKLGGEAFEKAFTEAAKGAGRGVDPGPGKDKSTKEGTAQGGAFGQAFKQRVTAAMRSIPKYEAEVSLTDAQRKLAELQGQLKALGDKKIGVDIDAADALAELKLLEAELSKVERSDATVDVRVDAATARRQISSFADDVEKILDRSGTRAGGAFASSFTKTLKAAATTLPDIEVNADTDAATAKLVELRQRMEALSKKTVGVDLDAAEAVAEISAIQAELEKLDGENVSPDVRLNSARAQAEIAAFQAQLAALDAKDVDVDVRVDRSGAGSAGLNSFSGRMAALVAIVGTLVPTLVPIGAAGVGVFGALTAGIAPVISGVGVLALGLSGIGDAVGALSDRQLNAAQDAQAAADQQEQAAIRIASAEAQVDGARRAADATVRRNRKAIEDATDAIEEAEASAAAGVARAQEQATSARERATDVAEQGAQNVTQALSQLEAAELRASDAQREARGVQEDLNAARLSASRELEDLQRAVSSGVLDERDAVLQLQQARQDAARVGTDPTSTGVDREQSAIRVARAEQRLSDVRLRNSRAQQDFADAERKGVEGSDQVVAALEREERARREAADSRAAVSTAQTDLQRAEADQIKNNARARADVERADFAVRTARIDGDRAVLEAQEGLAEATITAQESQIASTQALESAQTSLRQALAATAVEASTSQQKVDEELGKLSPAGQAFALYLFSLRPELQRLRATAQTNLLPGLTEALEIARPSLPGVNAGVAVLAGTMGDLAVSMSRALTGPMWRPFFEYMGRDGAQILIWIAQAVGYFALALANLIVAFEPVTDFVLAGLAAMMRGFSEWSAGLGENQAFQNFISYIIEAMPIVGEFIGSTSDLFVTLVKSMAPFGEAALEILGAIFDFVAAIPPGVIQFFVTALLGIISVFVGIAAVVGTVIPAILTVVGVLGAAGTAWVALGIAGVAALVALWQHSETFRDIVTGAFQAVGNVAVWLWNNVLKPAFQGLVDYYTTYVIPVVLQLWHGVFVPAFTAIGDAATNLWNNYIFPAFAAVRTFIVGSVAPAIMGLWRDVFVPAFQAIGAAVDSAWRNYIWPAVSELVRFFRDTVAPIIVWLWKNVVTPAFMAIGAIIQVAWVIIKAIFTALVWFIREVIAPVIGWLWNNIVKPAFAGIAFVIQAAWTAIKLIFGAIEIFIRAVLAPVFTWLWEKIISPVWDWISTKIANVWNNSIKPALQAFGGFIQERVAPAFETGVSAIAAAWDAIIAVVQKPIEFVVNTVINDGIIKAYNSLAKTFGVDEIAPLVLSWQKYSSPRQRRGAAGSSSRATEFATGGVIPGYTPGVDVHQFVSPTAGLLNLSGGEAVMRPEWTRAVGPDFVNTMNRIAITGGAAGVAAAMSPIQSLAAGGFIKPAPGPITSGFGPRWGRMHSGVDWGTPIGTPVQAAADGVVQVARFHPSWGNHIKLGHAGGLASNIAHLTRDIVSPGQMVKQGDIIGYSGNTGNSTGPHVHFEIYVGGKRVNPAPYLTGGNVGAGPGGEGSVDPGFYKTIFETATKGLLENIPGADTGFGKIGVGVVSKTIGNAAQWAAGKAAALFGSSDPNAGDAGFSSAGTQQWAGVAAQALSMLGLPASLLPTVLRRMNQESGGNSRAINLWDSNARAGIPSKGLMQVIDPTFRANALPGYNKDIYDPLSNILASLRYTLGRYGSIPAGYNRKGGYFSGGIIPTLYDTGGIMEPGFNIHANKTRAPEAVFTNPQFRDTLTSVRDASSRTPSELTMRGAVTVNGLEGYIEAVAYEVKAG